MVKQLRQVVGVRHVKVSDFKKAVLVVTPKRGAVLSETALAEAVRRSGFTLAKMVSPGGRVKGKSPSLPRAGLSTSQPSATDAERALAQAGNAFRKRDYVLALKLARELAGKQLDSPKPVGKTDKNLRNEVKAKPAAKATGMEVQQLLSLCAFALGRYDDASTAAHAALHRGAHWNWKTLSGHYQNPDEYSKHLRALENQIRKSSSVETRFLVGYHYLMLGYSKAARVQLTRVAKLNPQDKLVQKLLRQLDKKPLAKSQ